MNARLKQITMREFILATAILLLLLGFWAVRNFFVPAYDNWSAARAMVAVKQLEHEKLLVSLSIQDEVDQRYARLHPAVYQTDTDQITISRFLRRVETLARHPNMAITSAKPGEVEVLSTSRIYPIRLTISGALPEVTRFVVGILEGPDITRLNSYSLRGVQGGLYVECSLSIWFITLTPESTQVDRSLPSSTRTVLTNDTPDNG